MSTIALAGQASAQAAKKAAAPAPAAAPAAAPALQFGPAIPGACVLSNERYLLESAVGKFVVQRLNQLKSQSDTELNAEAQTLQADANALQGKKATLPPDQFEQQGAAINLRYNALQRKAQQREAEINETQKKALGREEQEAMPVIRQAFVAHNCTILFNSGAVMAASPSMDLTQSVIQGLDAKITQFQFDREHLEQNQAAPAR
ncbi:OmpH family outer membrane protein [Phenylobacterium montanum]|uniref:OmpH family outer membrane protein n=1 Tax=Phenylobacterium montanum TaxID=2823693 RepID=A0A975FZV9_9CAUL|nr:OmpH family outer membrane protein [Caulobacter sp. S6]QUD88520.1 OmpH family outer membrane protein [Caulobacter sp. S6]